MSVGTGRKERKSAGKIQTKRDEINGRKQDYIAWGERKNN